MKENEDDIKKWKGYCANGLKAYVEDNHTTPGAVARCVAPEQLRGDTQRPR